MPSRRNAALIPAGSERRRGVEKLDFIVEEEALSETPLPAQATGWESVVFVLENDDEESRAVRAAGTKRAERR